MLAALALILISTTIGYIAVGTLIRLQGLNSASVMHLDNWRYVATRSLTVLQMDRRERDPTPMVGLAREHLLETFDETEASRQQVNQIADDLNTPLMRVLGFVDTGLLNEFIRSDVDPELSAATRELAERYMRPGDEPSDDYLALFVSLQNGEFLTPLLRRASLAGVMNEQAVRPLVIILVAVAVGIVIALWLIWSKSLAPALVMLDQKTRSLQASSDELAMSNAELSQRNAQILAAQRIAHICFWFLQGDEAPTFSPGFTSVTGVREANLPQTLEGCAHLSKGHEAQAALTIYRRLSREAGSDEITRTIRTPDLGDRIIRERIESSWSGNQLQLMAIMIDISDLSRASEEWSNAERIELVELITAGVAHDFNNLLAIISGHAEMMLSAREYSPRYADAILDAVQTAAAITVQLRARASLTDAEHRHFSARVAVRDCIDSLMKSAPKGALIDLKTDDRGDFVVYANRGLFENAIVNVLSNGREASEPWQKIDVILEELSPSDLSAAEQDGLASAPAYGRISVIDKGRGMSELTRKRAVEPFFSTKERGSGPTGRGLGLWSVFSFMQSVKGVLSIVSHEGTGTTVSMVFPLDKDSHDADASQTVTDTDQSSSGRRVLVVEDEEALAGLVGKMLELAGYSPVLSYTSDQALKAAREGPPFDFLLADVNLGQGMTGIDVANLLQSEHPDLKVVISSGLMSRSEFDQQSKADWRFLPKPYKLANLRKLLT